MTKPSDIPAAAQPDEAAPSEPGDGGYVAVDPAKHVVVLGERVTIGARTWRAVDAIRLGIVKRS